MRHRFNHNCLLLAVLVMSLNSCTLFIDDDELFNSKKEPLPTYHGKYYDEQVTEKMKNSDVTFQLQENTMILNADHELNKYIVRVDTTGSLTNIFFDKSVPTDMLPKEGQPIASGNVNLFKDGLCDMVYDVGRENGDIVVRLAPTDYTNVYKEFKISLHPDLREAFRSYSVYNEDGELIGKINQDEPDTSPAPHRVNGDANLATNGEEDPYKGLYDIDFSLISAGASLGFLIKEQMGKVLDGFQEREKNPGGLGSDFKCTLGGGIIFPRISCEHNLLPSSSEPLKFDIIQEHGGLTHIDLDLEVSGGMKDTYWFNVIPDNAQKLIDNFVIGPVSIDLFLEFGFKIDASFHIHPIYTYFWNGRITHVIGFKTDKRGDDRPSEWNWKELSLNGNFHFPMVRIGLGGGHKLIPLRVYAELIFDPTFSGVIDLRENVMNPTYYSDGNNSRIQSTGELQVGLVFRATGAMVSSILNKIKAKLPKVQRAWEAMGKIEQEYYKTGSLEDWNNFFNGKTENIDPDLLRDMNQKFEDTKYEGPYHEIPPEDRASEAKKKIMEEKRQEKSRVDSEVNSGKMQRQKNKKAADKNDPLKKENSQKVFELEIGPFKIVDLYNESVYCYPTYKEESFKIGSKWDDNKNGVIYYPQFELESPGMRSDVLGAEYKLSFDVYEGSDFVDHYPTDQLISRTSKNKIYKGELIGLFADKSYTCIPRYDFSKSGEFAAYGKSQVFSATKPAVAITSTRPPKVNHAEYIKEGPKFKCNFEVTVAAEGMRYIKQIGIIDNNDASDSKYHYDNDADTWGSLESNEQKSGKGKFTFKFKCESPSSKINLNLSPFIVPTEAQLKGNQATAEEIKKYAKIYSPWKAEIDVMDYITDTQSSSDEYSSSNAHSMDEYAITLESVTFTPEGYEADKEEDLEEE